MFDFQYYNSLGLNLYTSSYTKNIFNSNESNLAKSPNINIEKYKTQKQELYDLDLLRRVDSSGFGIILGYNDIYCLDIDGYFDENVIYNILYILGLPSNYEWVIKSGSGVGFHIIFCCVDLREYVGKTIAYFAREFNRDFCKIEFKFEGCSILPGSLHESGNYYSFYNSKPNYKPFEVGYDNLKTLELHYCSLQTVISAIGRGDDGFNVHIDFFAPEDANINFVFDNVLRPNIELVISGESLIISGNDLSSSPIFLVQIAILMIDSKRNIVFRRSFNYIDNCNIFSSNDRYISIDIANKIISGSKQQTLQILSNYLEIADRIISFSENEIKVIKTEIDKIIKDRHIKLHYVIYDNLLVNYRNHKLITFYSTDFTEIDYLFSFKFNKKVIIASALIKVYAVYFLYMDSVGILSISRKVTNQDLWETKTLNGLLSGELETFYKNNIKFIESYLSENFGYKYGPIGDFLENSKFEGSFENFINVIKDIRFQQRKKAQEWEDYIDELKENYEPNEDDFSDKRRERERDNFDALTDGQYGSFENFNGDSDSLRDSIGL